MWPLLSNTTFFVVTIATIFSFQAFDQMYVMTDGGPFFRTETLVDVLIYSAGFEDFDIGYASAISWVLVIDRAGPQPGPAVVLQQAGGAVLMTAAVLPLSPLSDAVPSAEAPAAGWRRLAHRRRARRRLVLRAAALHLDALAHRSGPQGDLGREPDQPVALGSSRCRTTCRSGRRSRSRSSS